MSRSVLADQIADQSCRWRITVVNYSNEHPLMPISPPSVNQWVYLSNLLPTYRLSLDIGCNWLSAINSLFYDCEDGWTWYRMSGCIQSDYIYIYIEKKVTQNHLQLCASLKLHCANTAVTTCNYSCKPGICVDREIQYLPTTNDLMWVNLRWAQNLCHTWACLV